LEIHFTGCPAVSVISELVDDPFGKPIRKDDQPEAGEDG
jgi:hypothetical protein